MKFPFALSLAACALPFLFSAALAQETAPARGGRGARGGPPVAAPADGAPAVGGPVIPAAVVPAAGERYIANPGHFQAELAPRPPVTAPRQMENLGRGVVALHYEQGKVWVAWRLLGTEPDEIAFNVYRQTGAAAPVKLTATPIKDATFFVDDKADLTQPTTYTVRPVRNGAEGAPSRDFLNKLPANPPVRQYVSLPLQSLERFQPNDASVADLDGDGELEIIVHQVSGGRDNSQGGITGEPVYQAYKMDGTLLWQINLGKNIRSGAHYTQFLVYDFDGDGRAEMMCKTAPGTVDGTGKYVVLGNDDPLADYRSANGHILSGPEYLTVFDGLTGKALSTVPYVPARSPNLNPTTQELQQAWGDGNGNRGDRYLAAVAYLDGERPSAVFCRGYYSWTNLVAWDWRDGKLTQRWYFNGNDHSVRGGRGAPGPRYNGQGNHNLSVADADGDGRDEIMYGAMAVDDNGQPLWTTNYGHGDALHVSDLNPANPGLEVFDIQERFDDAGMHMEDARTGRTLWKVASVEAALTGGDANEGPGRGLAADIDPRHPGWEAWAFGAGLTGLYSSAGERISNSAPRSCNFTIYWDGDVLCELWDGGQNADSGPPRVDKWNWNTGQEETIFVAEGTWSNNGTKQNPAISGDLFGDWREEFVVRSQDGRELRFYSTVIPTPHRFYTLLHDPQYRLALAWQNTAYNQPPHPGFQIGQDMPAPPKPNIVPVRSAAN